MSTWLASSAVFSDEHHLGAIRGQEENHNKHLPRETPATVQSYGGIEWYKAGRYGLDVARGEALGDLGENCTSGGMGEEAC